MDAAGLSLTIAGVLLVLLGFTDAVITTTAIAEFPGPLTRLLSVSLWRGVRSVTRRSDNALLRAAGSLVVLSVLSAWVLSLWLGWSLVFAGSPGAVVMAETGEHASFASTVYFTAASMATTGLGDFVPSSDGWRLLTGLVSISGLVLITLGVTYLVPVIQAGVNRLHLAQRINAIGSTPYEILDRHFDHTGFAPLEGNLPDLVDNLTQLRAEHLAYPVLHFLHGARIESAIAPRLAALDEAVTMLRTGVAKEARTAEGELRSIREAVDELVATVLNQAFAHRVSEVPPAPSLEPLRAAGIPTVDDDEFLAAIADEAPRRRRLLAFVLDDSWRWADVYRDA